MVAATQKGQLTGEHPMVDALYLTNSTTEAMVVLASLIQYLSEFDLSQQQIEFVKLNAKLAISHIKGYVDATLGQPK